MAFMAVAIMSMMDEDVILCRTGDGARRNIPLLLLPPIMDDGSAMMMMGWVGKCDDDVDDGVSIGCFW